MNFRKQIQNEITEQSGKLVKAVASFQMISVIVIAGYTFFMSRIDALMATDAALDYIVGSVKMRFKSLIWYITAVYERKRDFPRAAMTFGIAIL